MATETGTRIEGPTTATVHQALGWVMRNNPASGSCDHSEAGGGAVEFLWETDRLSKKLGWDFAVVAAHASAMSDAFRSPAWTEAMNTIPVEHGAGAASAAMQFASPQEAAAAHIAYLATLTSGGNGITPATSGDAEIGLNELRNAGYWDLLPSGSSHAVATSQPVQALTDLPLGASAQAELVQHLAGIRDAAVAQEEPEIPDEAPPLPRIEWVPTDNYQAGPVACPRSRSATTPPGT
jgi:hypothetical protein